MLKSIKHITFASPDATSALRMLENIFGQAPDAEVADLSSHYRVARFSIGDVQIQFCEPLEGDRRFSRHLEEFGPGLHHICFSVDNIDEAIAQAKAHGVGLMPCLSCGVTGSHPHPEGWIAFFGTEAAPELQIEVMQVYGPGEKERFWGDRAEI